jgi:LmbE family N-acetylglucosaminyl deacetylase
MIAAMSASLRPILRLLARKGVFPLMQRGWEFGFLLAGMLLRPAAARRVPTGSDRLLVVAPHPDDETLGCGGTVARHAEAGDDVCVLVVTDGGSSRAGGIGRDEMRQLRAREAVRAMRSLGHVDLVQLGLPEGRWSPEDLHGTLEALLRHGPPSLIYAPSCVDFHPEHVKVARALAHTLRSLGQTARPLIRVYEVQVPLTHALANVAVEVGSTAASKKAAAISEYRTQRGTLESAGRHGRYLRRLYRTRHAVEVFWELDAESYCRLMEAGGPRLAFRGIRPTPFGDGLAWLAGLRERKRLKKLAEDWAAP